MNIRSFIVPGEHHQPGREILVILNYIQHHLFDNEKLKIKSLASQFHIAPSYFGEYFYKHARENLQGYILKSRLKVAESRILYSNKSIKEIADELGFTDTSHLSRTFTNFYDCNIREAGTS